MNKDRLFQILKSIIAGNDISVDVPDVENAAADPEFRATAAGILLRYYIKNRLWNRAASILQAGSIKEREIAAREFKSLLDLATDIALDGMAELLARLLNRNEIPPLRESASRAMAILSRQNSDLKNYKKLLEGLLIESNRTIRGFAAEALARQSINEHDWESFRLLLRRDNPLLASKILGAVTGCDRAVFSEKERDILVGDILKKINSQHKDVRHSAYQALRRIVETEPDLNRKKDSAVLISRELRPSFEKNRAKSSADLLEYCDDLVSGLVTESQLPRIVVELQTAGEAILEKNLKLLNYSRIQGLDTTSALDSVRKLLNRPPGFCRELAVRFLAYYYMDSLQWGEAEALLRHPDADVREEAAGAAHIQGIRSDISPLIGVLSQLTSGDEISSQNAELAITGTMITGRSSVEAGMPNLARKLFSENLDERENAARDLAAGSVMGSELPEQVMNRLKELNWIKQNRQKSKPGFPDFLESRPLSSGRSWSAVFESFDQKNDDLYYVISIYRAGYELSRFMVKIFDDPSAGVSREEREKRIENDLFNCAKEGRPNTSYRGSSIYSFPGMYSDLLIADD